MTKKVTPVVTKEAAPEHATNDATLTRTQWFVRNKQGWLVGTHAYEVLDSTEVKEPRAFVWDGRYRLLGLFPLKVPLLPPKRKFVVRDGEPRGPVILSLGLFPPLMDYLPIGPARPARWEVRDGHDTVVGSILVSPGTFSLVKLATKGQFFQDEHFWLDAKGQRSGKVGLQRSKFGLPGALLVTDMNGEELAGFGTAHGQRFHADLKKGLAAAAGKPLPQKPLPPDSGSEGVIGNVSPDQAKSRYVRTMTFAMTVLMQIIGPNKFTGAVTQKA